ncbi:MAG: hypothetical protein CSA15_12420 [Candidatus Delongbacteria bacterium]|nr:MAG: hypothetical protein CSA15_12420 [Candidatus Delongbacteria bacterium]
MRISSFSAEPIKGKYLYMTGKIIIVEDRIGKGLISILNSGGYEDIKLCVNSQEFEKCYKKFKPHLILLDIHLANSEMDGVEIYRELKKDKDFDSKVIILSGEANRAEIAEGMKLGAYTFIEKSSNFDEDKFLIDVGNAIDIKIQKDRIKKLETELLNSRRENSNYIPLIGESPKIKKVKQLIDKLSNTNVDIFIVGETGTGKEVVANNIHYLSNGHNERFIAIDCSAIPDSLIESELFGHIKGSFTGASTDKKGYFESAGDGTIFLDEIENLSIEVQMKLLRVIENRNFYRVGNSNPITFNARVIFGTNESPEYLLQAGKMREDFYYRLDSAMRISLPSLSERGDDLLLLLEYFIRLEEREYKTGQKFCYNLEEIKDQLFSHMWKGNVRELKNFATKLIIMNDETSLTNNVILAELKSKQDKARLIKSVDENEIESLYSIEVYKEAMEEFEKRYLERRLYQNRWNKSKTADQLKYDRTALYKKMSKYGLNN